MDNVGEGYGIPFRCLIPQGIEGLLVAGAASRSMKSPSVRPAMFQPAP
jgi:hypothetical protein